MRPSKAMRMVEDLIDTVEENLDDPTIDNMTDADIMNARTLLAEQGTELTPGEIRDAVTLIRYTRDILRS